MLINVHGQKYLALYCFINMALSSCLHFHSIAYNDEYRNLLFLCYIVFLITGIVYLCNSFSFIHNYSSSVSV